MFADDGRTGQALDSMVCAGVIISGASVRRSVLSPSVHVHAYAEVDRSVLFSGVEVGRGAIVRNAILDKDVVVEPGAQIGVDLEGDRERLHGLRRRGRRGPQGNAGSSRRARLTVRVALLTREYPPEVYGGAGVHVEYLGRELRGTST